MSGVGRWRTWRFGIRARSTLLVIVQQFALLVVLPASVVLAAENARPMDAQKQRSVTADRFELPNIERVSVPAATSYHGCSAKDELCDADEGPPGGKRLHVPPFVIDVHETSVAEYRACVEAGSCTRPFDFRRVHYCNYDAPGRDDYPVNCVNWQQAYEYCAWHDGRLAYAVEWERAARAGTQTPYPWGSDPADCTRAVMDPGLPGQPDTQTDGCWRDLSWPRGQFPPNSLGLHDMVGGTSEWVMDWYHRDALSTFYGRGVLTGPSEGKHKVIKGGSWDEKIRSQRVSNQHHKPIKGNPDLYGSNGIRCVIPQPESLP